ncbi:putative glycosyl transferase protein [Thermococcus cleftensis]|uniref:Glycosyl transferase protein n=1 Tax=Thermococcus cleftensis (strain DSM 27260 / KACC 17922 / CL1) TaxID=163003 RepID=I3ZVW7_THECF|nr:glycosyltransferase family 2 protein [Thermococcus cleftensis]AFL95851.1 putative glycosyl transferase protein [Thermococcus cleftensis]
MQVSGWLVEPLLGILEIVWVLTVIVIYPIFTYYIVLTLEGLRYNSKFNPPDVPKDLPSVTVLIPARNEGVVIRDTLLAMANLDYPRDKLEVLLLDDGSTDETVRIAEEVAREHPFIRVIRVEGGGRGKSYVLNYGLKLARGEVIAVYDADNRPEPGALKGLVAMLSDETPAVTGKVRTINWNRNVLTRFICMEYLYFQLAGQSGKSKLYKTAILPGTNFVIRRDLLEELGGWDENALAEDLELSFRVIALGKRIAYNPLAVTWEQEPESWRVWFRQRTRWAAGNVYTVREHVKRFREIKGWGLRFDLLLTLMVYYLLAIAVIVADVAFVALMMASGNVTWFTGLILSFVYLSFLLEIFAGLYDGKIRSIGCWLLAPLMYYTYSQMWILISLAGLWEARKAKKVWYKTPRTAV